jgi:hypothetical protein
MVPSGMIRATHQRGAELTVQLPATTILPSGCTTTDSRVELVLGPPIVMNALPVPLNDVSTAPEAVSRVTQNEVAGSTAPQFPARIALLSLCNASARTESANATPETYEPPLPYVVSTDPGCAAAIPAHANKKNAPNVAQKRRALPTEIKDVMPLSPRSIQICPSLKDETYTEIVPF